MKVDEQVGRVEAQVQRRQQALAARKEARLTFAGSIGALTSPLIAEHAPLLTQAAAYMAHPAIRNLGTMGGSGRLQARCRADFRSVRCR
jgi:CO/xanthine dehydrogenase FAD-binding subunit